MKRKRDWLKQSSLVLSAVVSMAAPASKASFSSESKNPKPCKKSKSPLSSVADEVESDNRPPFGDTRPPRKPKPVLLRHKPGKPLKRTPAEEVRPTLPARSAVEVCCATPETAAEEIRKALPVRPPLEEVRVALPAQGYPWKKDIATTVFWIGEKPSENNPTPNHASSWDAKWARHYGGYDNPDPDARVGYLPADFMPQQNPFYVALPYNDIGKDGQKEEASKIIPWFKKDSTSEWKSVCKGRWIAIRKGDKVCYAQWEDAGPFTTTDSDYVFGDARPKPNPNHNAGLDVSPAVRDFLGIDGNDVTDWKFVEFEEIPQGPWAEHGENNHFVMNRRKEEEQRRAVVATGNGEGSGPRGNRRRREDG